MKNEGEVVDILLQAASLELPQSARTTLSLLGFTVFPVCSVHTLTPGRLLKITGLSTETLFLSQ